MKDQESIDEFSFSETPKNLPNSTATLVLGVISIATFWLYGIIGIICGIIALVLARQDQRIYQQNPKAFENAWKTSNAGRICAIIGLILSAFMIIMVVFVILFVLSAGPRGFDF